jgi:hypothetical protein
MKRITYHPAECCPRACEERDCPYMHHDSWSVESNGNHFLTRADAERAAGHETKAA